MVPPDKLPIAHHPPLLEGYTPQMQRDAALAVAAAAGYTDRDALIQYARTEIDWGFFAHTVPLSKLTADQQLVLHALAWEKPSPELICGNGFRWAAPDQHGQLFQLIKEDQSRTAHKIAEDAGFTGEDALLDYVARHVPFQRDAEGLRAHNLSVTQQHVLRAIRGPNLLVANKNAEREVVCVTAYGKLAERIAQRETSPPPPAPVVVEVAENSKPGIVRDINGPKR